VISVVEKLTRLGSVDRGTPSFSLTNILPPENNTNSNGEAAPHLFIHFFAPWRLANHTARHGSVAVQDGNDGGPRQRGALKKGAQSMTDWPQSTTERPQWMTDWPQSMTDWPQWMTDWPQSMTKWLQSMTDWPQSMTKWLQSMTEWPQWMTDWPQWMTDWPQSMTEWPQSMTQRALWTVPRNLALVPTVLRGNADGAKNRQASMRSHGGPWERGLRNDERSSIW